MVSPWCGGRWNSGPHVQISFTPLWANRLSRTFIGKNYFCPGKDYEPAPSPVKTSGGAETSAAQAAKIDLALCKRRAVPIAPRCNKVASPGLSNAAVSRPRRSPKIMQKAKTTRPAKTVYSAPALEKGFDIIELLAAAPDGLTSTEIAQRLKRSLSEIFRVLVVMERRGWLSKNSETDRYSVSYHVLEHAFRATPVQGLSVIAAPIMYGLALATEQSCHMAVISHANIIIVLQQDSPGHSGFSVRLGDKSNVVTSCSSHVLLAFSDRATEEKVLATARSTPPSELKKLRERLKLVARRGYETKPSSRHVGVHDISYPIFGSDGRIRAALTIPFLSVIDGTQRADMEQARKMLADAAQKISRGLGWIPPIT
jgi:DNA-binding IclR family transcriptional regulator